MRSYVLRVTVAGIAIGLAYWQLTVHGVFFHVGEWTPRIAWFALTGVVAMVLARRQRLPVNDAVFGYIAAMVIALIVIGAAGIIGFFAALQGG
jgi:hypothetical protein